MLENRLFEVIIVLLLVMLLFGAKRLPDTARALGKSLRILKSETRAASEEAQLAAQPTAVEGTVAAPTATVHTTPEHAAEPADVDVR